MSATERDATREGGEEEEARIRAELAKYLPPADFDDLKVDLRNKIKREAEHWAPVDMDSQRTEEHVLLLQQAIAREIYSINAFNKLYRGEGNPEHKQPWIVYNSERLPCNVKPTEGESKEYREQLEQFPYWVEPVFKELHDLLGTYEWNHSFAQQPHGSALIDAIWEPADAVMARFPHLSILTKSHGTEYDEEPPSPRSYFMVMTIRSDLRSINLPERWVCFTTKEKCACIEACRAWLKVLKEEPSDYAPKPWIAERPLPASILACWRPARKVPTETFYATDAYVDGILKLYSEVVLQVPAERRRQLRREFKELIEREVWAALPPVLTGEKADMARITRREVLVVYVFGTAVDKLYTEEGSHVDKWIWSEWLPDDESKFSENARKAAFPYWQNPAFQELNAHLNTYRIYDTFFETASQPFAEEGHAAVALGKKRTNAGGWKRGIWSYSRYENPRKQHFKWTVDLAQEEMRSINLPQHWIQFTPSEQKRWIDNAAAWLAKLKADRPDGPYQPLPIRSLTVREIAHGAKARLAMCTLI